MAESAAHGRRAEMYRYPSQTRRQRRPKLRDRRACSHRTYRHTRTTCRYGAALCIARPSFGGGDLRYDRAPSTVSSSCSTARRTQLDTDRSSASARCRTRSSVSAGKRTGTNTQMRQRYTDVVRRRAALVNDSRSTDSCRQRRDASDAWSLPTSTASFGSGVRSRRLTARNDRSGARWPIPGQIGG